jgi:hypothetical protein
MLVLGLNLMVSGDESWTLMLISESFQNAIFDVGSDVHPHLYY